VVAGGFGIFQWDPRAEAGITTIDLPAVDMDIIGNTISTAIDPDGNTVRGDYI